MWMEKLSGGVLRVLTPLGPRYLRPLFFQRIYLLWIFRNFETLPAKVLSRRQLRMIDGLCAANRFVAMSSMDAPLLGTLEQRPPAQELPPRRPNSRVSEAVGPFAADVQQRS